MEEIYEFNRLLVALDLSEHDESLIAYVSKMSKLSAVDTIYFVHVVSSLKLPDNIKKKYPDLIAPVDEGIRKSIEYTIEAFGSLDDSINIEIIIREGDPIKEILNTIREKSIDLTVLGRKSNQKANLRIIKKIVRVAPCSVSIIPEYLPELLHKILVPVDFSENALMSLRRATFFSQKFSNLEILTLHCYEVPQGYSKIGKTFDEFSQIMMENAKSEMDHFLAEHKLEIKNHKPHYTRCKARHLPSALYQFAVANNVNAIVIGSRGRDSISNFLLGSVTEGLIEHDQYMPLIIVKSKTDHMGVLKAIQAL